MVYRNLGIVLSFLLRVNSYYKSPNKIISYNMIKDVHFSTESSYVSHNQKNYLSKVILESVANNFQTKMMDKKIDLNEISSELIDILIDNIEEDSESKRRKILSTLTEKIARIFQSDQNSFVSFVNQEGKKEKWNKLNELIQNYKLYQATSKDVFECITSTHNSMKLNNTLPNSNNLPAYGEAAYFMGKKDWVMLSNEWLLEYSENYFLHGENFKCFLKKKRKYTSIQSKDVTLNSEEEGGGLIQSYTPPDLIRLLDVGSCYNPLQSFKRSELFSITALDIFPMHPSVYKCNFLDLEITSQRSSENDTSLSSANNELKSLTANTYNVITMSLVLSYLPSPELRRDMVLKAKNLLFNDKNELESGILLIVEKESIFSKVKNDKASLQNWRKAMQSYGFENIYYKNGVFSNRHTHLFAFKVMPENFNIPKDDDLMNSKLWIQSDKNIP